MTALPYFYQSLVFAILVISLWQSSRYRKKLTRELENVPLEDLRNMGWPKLNDFSGGERFLGPLAQRLGVHGLPNQPWVSDKLRALSKKYQFWHRLHFIAALAAAATLIAMHGFGAMSALLIVVYAIYACLYFRTPNWNKTLEGRS